MNTLLLASPSVMKNSGGKSFHFHLIKNIEK